MSALAVVAPGGRADGWCCAQRQAKPWFGVAFERMRRIAWVGVTVSLALELAPGVRRAHI
eukprot:4882539-Prymnesium_polylepis.3